MRNIPAVKAITFFFFLFLQGLPFSKVAHSLSTIDTALVANSVLVVVVNGQLKVNDLNTSVDCVTK